MVNYRRVLEPGGTDFFTVVLRDRSGDALVRHIDSLRLAFRTVHASLPWQTDAIVVLPDHLHAIWTLPHDDSDYSNRWRAIKSNFVQQLRRAGERIRKNARSECNVWQPRFWEHRIRDENDLARHVDYVHINPVKHGYVEHTVDWRWSSFHHYLRRGLLASDWANGPGGSSQFGE